MKFKTEINYSNKFWVIILITLVSFINEVRAQETSHTFKSEEDKDWENLNYVRSKLCDAPKECEWLDKTNIIEYLKFEDNLNKKRSGVAVDFLEKYPNGPHYDYALNYFFSFKPLFISKNMTEVQSQFLSQFPKGELKNWNRVYRALPIDKKDREQWIKNGNELVAKLLASNASIDSKMYGSMGLISRDYLFAEKLYSSLEKDTMESDYWEYFDQIYWASFKPRLYTLMETYPDSESLENYIQSLFDGIKKYSPHLAKTYMEEFFIKTGDSNPLSNKKGIKAVHKTLGANLNALNKLEQSEGNMPVEMVFNDINGNKIDLSNMLGKVVLIDFWSIRCGPCIQEMPHLRAMYDKYQDQGFEVIGISADGDKIQVEQILKKTNANWPQRLDNGKDAKVSFHTLYNITSLPTVWLLDKNGVIVDRQARGERLEPLIRKYLGLE